jgi:putative ABC transport system permease protein
MEAIFKDLRYGLRLVARNPLITGLAVVTLALGIGASTAIFSVARGVLLEPLPYEEPDRLTMIWAQLDALGVERAPLSGPEITDLWQESRLYEDVGGIWPRFATLGDVDDPEQVHIGWVTGNFFEVLGARPQLGRTFLPEEDVEGGPQVILISHGVWQRRFGGAGDVIGRTVEFNLEPYTVVGVMPEGFEILMPPEAGLPQFSAWLPLQWDYPSLRRDFRIFATVGRLGPGVGAEQVRQELDAIAGRAAAEHLDYAESGLAFDTEALHTELVAPVKPALLTLLGAVGFVVLIACANVTNLLLVRAAARDREMALRAALGAPRGRMMRQLVVENLVLFLIGGATGLLVAAAALVLLEIVRPPELPRLDAVDLDLTVLGFNFLATLACGLVFCTISAWQATRGQLAEALKDGGRTTSAGRERRRLRGWLVAGEVALSVALLIGAGLLLRSFVALAQVEPGFQAAGVTTFRISLPSNRYPYNEPKRISAFYDQLTRRIGALGEVENVGATNFLPLTGAASEGDLYAFETPRGESEWGARTADFRSVTTDFLPAMGARLVTGRFFTSLDDGEHPPVAIVDEKLARLAWPGQDPIGRKLKVKLYSWRDDSVVWAEVVGVVEHVRNTHLAFEGREQIYLPHLQAARRSMTVAVAGPIGAASLAAAVRRELREIDPGRVIFDVRPLDHYVAADLAQSRFLLLLLALLAGLAAVLATVGIYGVIAYSVRLRIAELGVRLALGAQVSQIVLMVVGGGLRLAGPGVAVGVAVAFVASRGLKSLVYGISVHDGATFLTVAGLAFIVALAAAYLPARQASRVDPVTALRDE